MTGALVRAATVGAVLVAAHTARNARVLRNPPAAPRAERRVSVLVPARDEAARIGACITALLASRGVDELEVLVLDDGSSDGTAEVAAAAGRGDPRLRVLTGAELPTGWLGKPHACAQLATAATGDVLVFCDADVEVAPEGIAGTVALLEDADVDLVCPYPRQIVVGFGQRLVQPLLQWSWLALLPLRLSERSPRPSLTAANGQLLACRTEAYRAAGGHAAVRGEVLEDIALARAFKRVGLRPTMADGTRLATCHMYDDWPALVDGYTKSLWSAFSSPAGAAGAIGLLTWLFVLPPVAALRAVLAGRPRAAVVPALGYAAGVASRVVAARRTGGRVGDAPLHPLSITTLGWLAARSFGRRRAGSLRWKGRSVVAAATAEVDRRG